MRAAKLQASEPPETTCPGGLRIESHPSSAWPGLAAVWRELAGTSPHSSFFLTEAWVETWLETFGSHLDVSILLFRTGAETVGACLLAEGTCKRAMIPVRRISLNASGEPAADTTYIEFNNLLCAGGWEEAVSTALAEYLISREWDEVALDGFVPGPGYEALKRWMNRFPLRQVEHPSYFARLSSLRNSGMPYESALGRTSRKHLRQNIRAYSRLGPVRLETATGLDTALEMLDELAALNLRRWSRHAGPAVFASPHFKAFHRSLIRKCFAEKSVELLRVAAGQHTLGLVYNLVRNGIVYFYQCGFDYSIDKRLSPGTLTLAYVIQHYLDRGYDEYHFLSGETSYKRILSTDSRNLVWAVFQKPSLKLRLLNSARAGRDWLAAALPHKRSAGTRKSQELP